MNECCEPIGLWCCTCRTNCSPGSNGGLIKSKQLNGHYYCYDCYPKMADIYLADLKLSVAKKEME